ncbi:fimbrial protein [Salmonella enterica]|nr:fimbrial protein [Salmonella enterica]
MTERLLNMKTLILSGVFLFFAICDSVQANIDWSYCNATGHVSIQNINIKAGKLIADQELQRVTVPFKYTCVTTWKSIGPDYHATLSLHNVKMMSSALDNSGLGMDLIIQEGSQTPIKYTWKEIQKGFNGWASGKVFGQQMDEGKTYNLNGVLTVIIFSTVTTTSHSPRFLNISIPEGTFDIIPYLPSGVSPPTKSYTPLTVSAFNIRFIPDNSGRVIISPSVVRMGHFYTEYKETMAAREVPFMVTAQQNAGAQTPFIAPLAIEFRTNGLTLADADRAVILKNTKGEDNGFRLSVVDDKTGTPIKFNTKEYMDDINLDNDSGGKAVKYYKAKVESIPGAEIKTGDFSTAMTVIVTYI